jgi:hypothetical protein
MSAHPWILGISLILVGCRDKPAPSRQLASGSAAPSDVSTAPAPVPEMTAPVPKSYPPDLNLAEVTRKLDCGKGKSKHACEVWAEFNRAGRFTGETPSGEGRWFGRAHVVEKGVERSEYLLLVSRHVPTARVGPSDLPLMICTAPFAIELQVEAGHLWAKMNHGAHRGKNKNLAFRYLESYEPKDERGAINTTGPSVRLIGKLSEDIAYLRQPERKRLLMVQPAGGNDAAPGDGLYAEFWQAIW